MGEGSGTCNVSCPSPDLPRPQTISLYFTYQGLTPPPPPTPHPLCTPALQLTGNAYLAPLPIELTPHISGFGTLNQTSPLIHPHLTGDAYLAPLPLPNHSSPSPIKVRHRLLPPPAPTPYTISSYIPSPLPPTYQGLSPRPPCQGSATPPPPPLPSPVRV